MQTTSDEVLIGRIAGGDRLAMQVLFARHHVRVYRFVCGWCETIASTLSPTAKGYQASGLVHAGSSVLLILLFPSVEDFVMKLVKIVVLSLAVLAASLPSVSSARCHRHRRCCGSCGSSCATSCSSCGTAAAAPTCSSCGK